MPPDPDRLASVRSRAVRLLTAHFEDGDPGDMARGPDRNAPAEDLEHPMALASYLRALATCARIEGGVPGVPAQEWMPILVERLNASADDDGAWGLGFAWEGEPASEPYAITTARCVTSLVAAARAGCPGAIEQALRAAGWLSDGLPWERTPGGRLAPAYSPSLRFPLPNVAAQTAEALLGLQAEAGGEPGAAMEAFDAVIAWQEPGGWWPYAAAEMPLVRGRRGDRRYDLVHTAYVIEAMAACASSGRLDDRRRAEALGAFKAGVGSLSPLARRDGSWAEGVSVVEGDGPPAGRGEEQPVYLPPRRWLVRSRDESRPWGYGAALAALSIRPLRGGRLKLAERLLRRVEDTVARDGPSLTWGESQGEVRHAAHVAEGLALLAAAAAAPADPLTDAQSSKTPSRR
jgi:hypothetical protein